MKIAQARLDTECECCAPARNNFFWVVLNKKYWKRMFFFRFLVTWFMQISVISAIASLVPPRHVGKKVFWASSALRGRNWVHKMTLRNTTGYLTTTTNAPPHDLIGLSAGSGYYADLLVAIKTHQKCSIWYSQLVFFLSFSPRLESRNLKSINRKRRTSKLAVNKILLLDWSVPGNVDYYGTQLNSVCSLRKRNANSIVCAE